MIRVALVDDHSMILEGLSLLLGSDANIDVVATAQNGKAAIELATQHQIDVMLLDINMPEMDGLETCLLLKNEFPMVKVIALTTHDEGQIIAQMMQNGAMGYVLKNAKRKELISAITQVYEGNKVLNPDLTIKMINGMQQPIAKPTKIKLTRREKVILRLIADEKTTPEIADELFVSHNTVQTHKRNLFAKLKVKTAAGLVRTAMENGLLK